MTSAIHCAVTIALVLLVLLTGCSEPCNSIVSGWSGPANGLQMRIESASLYHRDGQLARFEVTCTVRNSGTTGVRVAHLARLHLADSTGATRACQRREDAADLVPARPTVPPGGTTSWKQDGQIETRPGTYQLFAVWDGDPNVKSAPVNITIQ